MKKPTALVTFMTGTGNTARAATVIADQLQDKGWSTRVAELGREPLDDAGNHDLLVLCFPVLGFGMPGLVRKKLRRFRGNGRPAAVFATWGGEGGAALWQGRWLLTRRGYRVVGTGGASFPFQWTQVFPPPSADDARQMVQEGAEAAAAFGRRLSDHVRTGITARQRDRARRVLNSILWFPVTLMYSWIGRYGLAAMYAADENCRACGICERQCAAAAISLAGKGAARRPRWSAACEGCNRCINLCPRRAVQVSPIRAAVHLVLNVMVIAGVVIGLNAAARAAAAAAPSVPGAVTGLAYAAALIAMIVLGSRLQFVALEPLLFALEGIPAVRRLAGMSWTRSFPRYRCPGFRPRAAG